MIYDLVIIGSGPAGLTAAIYAQRAMLKTVVIEKSYSSGGQIINTYEVDNYTGIPKKNGYELASDFRNHANSLGAEFIKDEVVSLEDIENIKRIHLKKGNYIDSKTVIIASGAEHRKLGIEGEKELTGKGVSYCAICDGAFFKQKDVVVIGGGDVACEDAIFLSKVCKKVYLMHRRNSLRAAKIIQDKISKIENIEIIWNSIPKKIIGENNVTSIAFENVDSKIQKEINVDGVFIAIGMKPLSDIFINYVDMDEYGYIIAGEDGKTSRNGVFVCGDIRTKYLRQIITACADGANCVYSAEKYIAGLCPTPYKPF